MSEPGLDDHHTPESVGPYRIVERLGAGGMGVVYRARDERLERWVAIKHIRPGEADARSRERLRREARTVAGLSHPAIVQVHDIVETGAGDWIVMELVEGETLKELVERRALAMPQILQLAREIAEGLAEAHAKGIVHRDLKSENVKVTELGHAKILDFGLAKRVWQGRQEESLSVQGAILGTGRAMSPEQALGEEVTHLSDLFSFGTLLFETVTRRPPFVGSSLILTMAQICTEEQPSARDLNPEVPRELSNLVDHLLEKDPLQRPQSAGEVVEALQRIAARMASRAVEVDPGDPSDTAVAPALPPESPSAFRPFPAVARLSSRGSGARSPTMSRSSESTAGIFIKTLVETSLSECDGLGDRFGDADVFELYSRHDRLARDVLAEHDGLEIQRSDEGFLFLFERPVDAVEFVLVYHERLAEFATETGVELRARAAIHLSEIFLRENTPEEIHRGAKPFEVEGLAKLIVSRVTSMAHGGQTLLTQEAYDMTRRALIGHPLADRKLHWRSHGHFLFSGADEAVSIFQVSTEPIEGGERLAESGEVRRLDDERSGTVSRRPDRKRSLLAVAALVPLIAAGAFYVRVHLMRPPPPADPEAKTEASAPSVVKPSLAILGFKNLGNDTGKAWLSTALEDLLSTELAAGGDIRLIAGESVARMRDGKGNLLRDDPSALDTLAPDTLRNIYDDFGSDYVILGSYLADDKQLTVQMQLQDARLGETVASVRESGVAAELGELTGLVFRIGNQVRAKLQLSRRFEAAQTTLSSSNEANRLYFSGKRRFSSFDFLGARDDFLEATQLDPSFAMAHAALARAWLTLGYEANAADSGKRAYELAGSGLPREDFLLIEGTYYESTGDLAGAIRTQTALWRFYPDRLEYGVRLADLQTADGKSQDAMATIKELHGLPAPMNEDPQIDFVEARAAMELGRYEQVAEAAGRAILKGRSRQNSHLVAQALRLRGRALVELKRLVEAAADLDEALALYKTVGDDLGLGETLNTLAFMEQGKRNPSKAEHYLRQALDIFLKTGGRKSIMNAKHGLAYMIQRKGELTAARQLLEESLQVARGLGSREDEIWVSDTLSYVLLQMGELVRAEKMIEELIALGRQVNDTRMESWALVNLGLTKLLAGKLDEASTIFDAQYRAAEEASNRHLGGLALAGLGAVYYAKGELTKAENAFSGYMKIQTLAGDWGDQALTEPVYASTLLALDKPGEALDTAMKIADRFETAEQPIYQAAALRVAAEALWQQNRPEKAREKLDEAVALAGKSENPEVRLRLELTSIRFRSDENPREAPRQLRPLIFEASRFNLKSVELEARLALGEIELRSDSTDDLEVGRARLEALADEASRLGFSLLAHQATASLGEELRPAPPIQPAAARPAP